MVNIQHGSMLKQGFLKVYYINDWSENLVSLFSIIFDKVLSVKNLNDDLNRIKKWAFQWKINFNTDPNKQAQEILFSRKTRKSSQPSLIFANNIVTRSITQKHLSWIFRNISRVYSVKLTWQLVYYGSSTTYYHDRLYLQFISPLLDLISIMVAWYMIKHITLHFTKN